MLGHRAEVLEAGLELGGVLGLDRPDDDLGAVRQANVLAMGPRRTIVVVAEHPDALSRRRPARRAARRTDVRASSARSFASKVANSRSSRTRSARCRPVRGRPRGPARHGDVGRIGA